MKHVLQICCKNNNISKEFPIGSTLLEIYQGLNLDFPYQVVSAKVNNRSEGLNFRVYNNKDVEFLDVRDPSGMRTYVRSLCFILYKAVRELFPQGKLYVEHPVSKGYFCNLRIGRPIELADVTAIKQRMQEIIAADIPFHRTECHTTEAVRIFSERGMNDKVKLLETSGSLYTYYYTLDDTVDYYYGNLLPSTGFIYRDGEAGEDAGYLQGTFALEPHHGLEQCGRLQLGLPERRSHRPHQGGRSLAREENRPDCR